MSEIMEQVRRQIAESYRVCPPPCPVDERRRELAEERERQARKEREAEEKRQVAANDWYAAVDDRVRTHFKDWAWAAIDERIQQWLEGKLEPLKDGIGGALGTIRKQVRGEFKHGIEEMCDAFGAQLAALEERLASNGHAARAAQGLAQRDELKRAIEEAQRLFETKLAALEERLRAVPGILPVAKTWCEESVIYEGEVVSHEGASYQALRDTAQMPGGSDWACIARAGRDGCDGLTLNFCGRHDAYEKYRRFDVVEFDGSSFVALYDNPSSIPGDDGWQILSKNGSRGPAGDIGLRGRKGERGARGEATPTVVSWTIDRAHYSAVPTLSNGTQGAVLELRPLFEQFIWEASYAVEAHTNLLGS